LGRYTSIQSPPKVSSTELELDEEGASKRLLRASSDSGHRIGVPAGAASEMGHPTLRLRGKRLGADHESR
jgi:hypothetical protein